MERYFSFKAASKARGMIAPYFRFMLQGTSEAGSTTPDFRDLGKAYEEFPEYYRTAIAPFLMPFEASRLEKLASLRRRTMIMALGLVLLALACYWILRAGSTEGFQLLLLGAALLMGWTASPIWMFQQEVKSEVFPRILRFLGPDFRYSPDGKPVFHQLSAWERIGRGIHAEPLSPWETESSATVQLSDFLLSGLLPKHDKSDEEDIVIGSREGVDIAMLESRQYVRGERSDRLVFHGLFIRLSLHKSFRGHTLVRTDHGLFNWTQDKQGLARVALEDPRFEKVFEVLSSDQVEARYLLTPSMMERLVALGSLFGQSKGIEAAFYDRHLLLKIPLKDERWFEGGDIFTPVTFEEDIRMIFSHMGLIFSLIELLRLHEQTRL